MKSGVREAECAGHALLFPGRKRESRRERSALADDAAEIIDDVVGFAQAYPEVFAYLAGEFEIERVAASVMLSLRPSAIPTGFMS